MLFLPTLTLDISHTSKQRLYLEWGLQRGMVRSIISIAIRVHSERFPAPTGSTNGTGLFQTITGLKIREVYEQLANAEIKPKV